MAGISTLLERKRINSQRRLIPEILKLWEIKSKFKCWPVLFDLFCSKFEFVGRVKTETLVFLTLKWILNAKGLNDRKNNLITVLSTFFYVILQPVYLIESVHQFWLFSLFRIFCRTSKIFLKMLHELFLRFEIIFSNKKPFLI